MIFMYSDNFNKLKKINFLSNYEIECVFDNETIVITPEDFKSIVQTQRLEDIEIDFTKYEKLHPLYTLSIGDVLNKMIHNTSIQHITAKNLTDSESRKAFQAKCYQYKIPYTLEFDNEIISNYESLKFEQDMTKFVTQNLNNGKSINVTDLNDAVKNYCYSYNQLKEYIIQEMLKQAKASMKEGNPMPKINEIICVDADNTVYYTNNPKDLSQVIYTYAYINGNKDIDYIREVTQTLLDSHSKDETPPVVLDFKGVKFTVYKENKKTYTGDDSQIHKNENEHEYKKLTIFATTDKTHIDLRLPLNLNTEKAKDDEIKLFCTQKGGYKNEELMPTIEVNSSMLPHLEIESLSGYNLNIHIDEKNKEKIISDYVDFLFRNNYNRSIVTVNFFTKSIIQKKLLEKELLSKSYINDIWHYKVFTEKQKENVHEEISPENLTSQIQKNIKDIAKKIEDLSNNNKDFSNQSHFKKLMKRYIEASVVLSFFIGDVTNEQIYIHDVDKLKQSLFSDEKGGRIEGVVGLYAEDTQSENATSNKTITEENIESNKPDSLTNIDEQTEGNIRIDIDDSQPVEKEHFQATRAKEVLGKSYTKQEMLALVSVDSVKWLRVASPVLRNDVDIAIEALKNNPDAISFVGKEVLQKPTFQLRLMNELPGVYLGLKENGMFDIQPSTPSKNEFQRK